MGRSPCCDKMGLKKGPWTPEEDQKLLAYIEEHGHGNWRALPTKAGLQRCGKSCRLRWTNYLRPDIKRGKFSLQEEQTIIQLHALLGNRWSSIATHLPKRTDNEIKNYWNTHLKKRLSKMGIDPVTHKPKNDALVSAADGGPQQSKNASNLSHMAQWESARLEAEARLARQSKLRSNTSSLSSAPVVDLHSQFLAPVSAPSSSSSSSAHHISNTTPPRCLDVLKAWHSTVWPNTNNSTTTTTNEGIGIGVGVGGLGVGIESPTSTLSFSENGTVVHAMGNGAVIEFMRHNGSNNSNYDQEDHQGMVKEEGDQQEWKRAFDNGLETSLSFSTSSGLNNDIAMSTEAGRDATGREHEDDDHDRDAGHDHHDRGFMEGFTELLLSTATTTSRTTTITSEKSLPEDQGAYNNTSGGNSSITGSDYYEDNKNYWNSILNLVSSPSHSPMF